MRHLLTSFLLIGLLVVLGYWIITPTAYAQTLPNNPYLNANTNSDVPQNLHTWTQSVMIDLMASLVCQLTGIDPTKTDHKCLGVDQTTGKLGFVQNGGGAIGLTSGLIAATFTHPPVSGVGYLAYMKGKFGITDSAYADAPGLGTGLGGISPMLKIWEAFRNIVYMAFVVVFVGIGLMIMLRVKIDPRTVMTIQNSIPKIILSLILVTLSFPIAGFLIDLMYIVIYTFINFASKFGIEETVSTDISNTRNVMEVFNNQLGLTAVVGGAAKAIGDSINQLAGGDNNFIIGFIKDVLLKGLVTPVGFSLAYLFILIAILWALLKLWLELIKAYFWIMLDIVIAPFWILAGLLPGSPVSFSAWLRDIGAHLSAFPVTIFMFILGKAFIESMKTAGAFVPPLIGNAGVDIKDIMALGVVLLTPQVVAMLKDAFKAPVFKYGAAIGQAVGVGAGAPGGIVGKGAGLGSTFYGLSYLPLVGPRVKNMLGMGGTGGTGGTGPPPHN